LPGTEDAGTTLSDITLAWMMSKAAALGLQFAPVTVAKYILPAAAKYALDEIHESWTPLWGFPAGRKISNNSSLSNSVAVRLQNNGSYRPGNLQAAANALSTDYAIVSTVG